MAENYMKQYIELSKEFKINNKSQDIIGKLYTFINILEKEDDKENKIILSCVYTLLGYHKKAYDLYIKIYDENNRKQKSKLFEMEQLSKSHGDSFTIKLKKLPKTNETTYTINDCIEKENNGEWKNYHLDKDVVIFNQIFNNEPMEISINMEIVLSEYISKINDYINWLNGDCKNNLIRYYNKNMKIEERANKEWYEELELYSVLITINKDGKRFADISCGDNYLEDHILDIEIEENKISSMNYDG